MPGQSDDEAGRLRPHHTGAAEAGGRDDAGGLRADVSGHRGGAVRHGVPRLDGLVPAPGRPDADSAPLSGGGRGASGPGRADGGAVGSGGGGEPAVGPCFTRAVARDGYAWWYVDAVSDDGAYGLTIIAFIGSVFSSYYKWARARGRGDPHEHCAVNVALYGRGARRWAMTERGSAAMIREADHLQIGGSALAWDGEALTIEIAETCAPLPFPLRGQVRLTPAATFPRFYPLDAAGLHVWRPIAPRARVEAKFSAPSLAWRGSGYFDFNSGDEPVENAFSGWSWSRADLGERAMVHYDARPLAGAPRSLALRFAGERVDEVEAPPFSPLPRSMWGIAREARSEPQESARVIKTLEDTPFYARSLIGARLEGASCAAMHESLDLRRFRSPLVQAMLPFRMPRRG